MHIGKNIQKVRELLSIKQEALACTLKVSQQTISKIEQNAHIREETVGRIALAMGVDVAVILNYDGQRFFNILKKENSDEDHQLQGESECHSLFIKIVELYERLIILEQENAKLLSIKK